MDAGLRRPSRSECVLAGWQAGMTGVLALLVWLGLTAWAVGRSFWTAANLTGSAFYGESALRPRFSWASLAGVAVYVLVYSTLGGLFGLAAPLRSSRLRLALVGVLLGMSWYYLAFRVLWNHIDPLVPLYTHDGPMLAGHVLYGALLGRLRRYLPAVPGEPAPAPPAEVLQPVPESAAAEGPAERTGI